MNVATLTSQDKHLGHCKSNAETAEHRQGNALSLGAQNCLANEVEDRSLRRLTQNCGMEDTADRNICAARRTSRSRSLNELTDSAAVGKRVSE